jgi:SAM-dependent methyltransferase
VSGPKNHLGLGNVKLAGLRFRCPQCQGSRLTREPELLRCDSCGQGYPLRGGRPVFTASDSWGAKDPLDRFKHPYKRFPRLYGLLVFLISPLYFDGTRRRFIRERITSDDGVYLNLGSGNTVLHDRVVNMDVTPYDSVDVVCDIATLPLQDDSVDVAFNISVLEHVPEPQRVLAEIRRVLRPRGIVYSDVPFVVGYHASPQDYYRWTHEGLTMLHQGFETERIMINGGPTSALLWVFQEWVAILLSFGSRRLHTLVYLLVMALTFPLKFLDVLLKRIPRARNIGSCFIYVGRKPGSAT